MIVLRSVPFRFPNVAQHETQTLALCNDCTTECKLFIDWNCISLQLLHGVKVLRDWNIISGDLPLVCKVGLLRKEDFQGVVTYTIVSVNYICRDSADMQYMIMQKKSISLK